MTVTKVEMDTKKFLCDPSGHIVIFSDSPTDATEFYVEILATGEHVNQDTGELRPTPYINSLGKVVVSSTPVAIPAGLKKPETLEETVNRILSHSMLANYYVGDETIDEADNFDIPDDIPDPVTIYERQHGAAVVAAADKGIVRPPTPEELTKSQDVIQRAKDFVKSKRATPLPSAVKEAPVAPPVPEK